MNVNIAAGEQYVYVFIATYCGFYVQEAKKVLFYYPADVELDTKIRQIGLCEAVIKFTRYVMFFNVETIFYF